MTAAQVPAIAVAATFTAEPVKETLEFWARQLKLDLNIRFAGFGQVFQELLGGTAFGEGFNVVLVRYKDLGGNGAEAELRAAIATYTNRTSTPLIVSVLDGEFSSAGLASTVYVLTPEQILSRYPVRDVDDPHAEELGKVPYTSAYFAALGTSIMRTIHSIQQKSPYKVIAVDCDDTLWAGICGEDGPAGVRIDENRMAIQQFLLKQREAGMLLAIASKNNEQDVIDTFEAHPEMPLRLEHFAAREIHWDPKPASIARIARELNVGEDSFVFLDDNSKECGQMRAEAPQVLTLHLPENAAEMPAFLNHVWALDHLRVTEEDLARANRYQQQAERARAARTATSIEEFVRSLDLSVTIAPARAGQLARLAQLTARTNQFNCSTIRRTESELNNALANGMEALAIDVSDRFGDYGLTGLVLFSASETALTVDTFLLSCRVLGRGVEHRVLARLGEIASARSLQRVDISFIASARNRPALEFLNSVATEYHRGEFFEIPVEKASSTEYVAPSADYSYEPEHQQKPIEPADAPNYEHIACDLRTVEQILAEVVAARSAAAQSSRTYVAPSGETETRLAEIWQELLRAPQVGANDDFFDLGGHSLLAVQLLARVSKEFNVNVSLDVVYGGAFTVAELAKAIEMDALLGELEGLSDEEVLKLLEQEQAAQGGDTL